MHPALRTIAVVLMALTAPLSARVISYAPYTEQIAYPTFHERTTRYFALLEAAPGNGWGVKDLVIYDGRGLEEPRVVYRGTHDTALWGAALYEAKNSGATERHPFLLISTQKNGQMKTLFSSDGGVSWSEVTALSGTGINVSSYSVDHGGPFTTGLAGALRTGNDSWPFIVSANGVWAVDSSGDAKRLTDASGAVLVGQNAVGTEFLVATPQMGGGITVISLEVVGLDGNRRTVATGLHRGGTYYGWITADRTVYFLVQRFEGRFLYRVRNGNLQFISGPYDVTPPPLASEYSGVYRPTENFFAVPTHDFEGAWILQRQTGKPTTLSRHMSSASNVETMWSDVTGPQVEALIAGKSGETLLVQVHRERDSAIGQIFIDPALAVWRIGQPAPRDYDELFLNETWSKGFIHVDVDTIEEGTPFVFNSGAPEPDDGIIISPPPAGGGDVIQEWGVVRASLKQHLVLPGVARLPGAFDSYWLTDVFVFNPSDRAQSVDVRYIAIGESVVQMSAARSVTLTLGAGEIRLIRDVLHSLFLIENGGGVLHFVPETGINVTGRTYSRNGEGTFGFGMQAIDLHNAASPRFPVSFAGAFPGEHFRTNVLLTDTSGRGTAANLEARGLLGTIGWSGFSASAPANGILQFNDLSTTLGLRSTDTGGLVLRPTRGGGIPTVVAIDNRTNDPTYFPPDLPASLTRVIPVIGHLDGAHGSRFRSDVYLFNPTATTQTVILEAKQWDSTVSKNLQFSLLPNEARVIPDALPTLFNMTGFARLRYRSWSGEGVRITSRTYTVEESGATYGSLIPPLNNFQMAGSGERLEIIGVGGGSGFRTNIGLVELSNRTSGSVRVVVSVIDGAGGRRLIDRFSTDVPAGGGMQINDIFSARALEQPETALIEIEVMESGVVGAYATVTDNVTNDTIYLGAQLGAQE